MSKKMFVREHSRSDFLFAEVGKPGFRSLRTGQHHPTALVVYTGVELTSNCLIEKAAKHGLTVTEVDAQYTLSNVVNFKIGNSVTHESKLNQPPDFELSR